MEDIKNPMKECNWSHKKSTEIEEKREYITPQLNKFGSIIDLTKGAPASKADSGLTSGPLTEPPPRG